MVPDRNKELEYIVSFMDHEIYRILRADLAADSFESVKGMEGDEVTEGCISEWLRKLAGMGEIHPYDAERCLAETDISRIREHFLAGGRKLSVSYRRLVGNGYKWVALRIIPAPDYSPDNQKVLMFVQEDDSAESLDLIQSAKQQFAVMRSLAKIYVSMHVIDLAADCAYDVRTAGGGNFTPLPGAAELMQQVIKARVADSSLADMLEFTDLRTVSQRMKGRRFLTRDFLGKTVGWCRAQFISVRDNPDGSAAYVIFATTDIDEEKKRENELLRISTELDLATAIQTNVIPHTFPAFPERAEFDLFASMDPAKEVGGDFYDFFAIDGSHLGLVIADVSGKGIPAALYMMISKVLIKNRAEIDNSPAKVLEKVNRQLCEDNPAEMFVTAWFGILNTETGVITAANAGHEYPAVRRAGGSFELLKDRHGLVLGGLETSRYQDYEIRLSKGDTLFVYTDGVPEANDAEGNRFGNERMLAALNSAPDADCRGLISNLRREIDAFSHNAAQYDDITMLALKYNGKAAPDHE